MRRWAFNIAAGLSLLALLALGGWRIFGGRVTSQPYVVFENWGGNEVVVGSGTQNEKDYGIYLGQLRLAPLLLFVLLLILPTIWTLSAAIRYLDPADSAQKADTGFCRVCGYDLRATPDRCPECGTIPTMKPASTK